MAGTAHDARHVFVAPHLDDVPLSCGGLVSRLAAGGADVVVATVVTADPPPDARLSALARRHHIGWGLGDAPFAERRAEDSAAAAILGARAVHLGLVDAIYRVDSDGRPHYARRILGAEPAPADELEFGAELRDALAPLVEDAEVYAPLGIGGHVDHRLVRAAIEDLVPQERIAYYEDYPYAGRAGARGPAGGAEWRAELVELTPAELDARLAATAAYVSQFPSLFPTRLSRLQEILRNRLPAGRLLPPPSPDRIRPHMRRQLHGYVARVGGERYWRAGTLVSRELTRAG